VSELVDHPLCDKTPLNKDGKTPGDIVCSRGGSSSAKYGRGGIHVLLQIILIIPLFFNWDDDRLSTS